MLKKAIDKVLNSGYNIRTGVEVSNRDEYTFDKAITNRVFHNIGFLDEALKEVVEPTGLSYVIAGGAVRDGLLGLEPKDYDIFLDLSPVAELEDEEREDFIALLNYNFHDKVGLQFPNVFETPWIVSEPAYKDMESNFLVYEHAFRGPNDDPARITENTYQLIYRSNSPEIGTDPLGFVIDKFDWSLTKAYYKDGKVFVGQQFVDAMKTKRIESTDLDTSRRIRSWYQRNFHHVAKAFKVSIEPEPPAASVYDDPTKLGPLTTRLDPDVFLRGARGVNERPAAINDWPQVNDLGQRIEIVNNPAAEIANEIQQLNDAHRAELDRQFWNDIQWRAVDNNENQAQVAPAVPEV